MSENIDLRIEESEQIGELIAALAKAQKNFTPVDKNKKGHPFSGKLYMYSDWSEILKMALPKLNEQELVLLQPTYPCLEDGTLYVVSSLYHSSGQFMRSYFPVCSLKAMKQQDIGSSMTYAKRYGGSALLGISTEEDTDAQGSEVRTGDTPRQQRPASNEETEHQEEVAPEPESEVAKKLYAKIVSDDLTGNEIGFVSKEIDETVKKKSRSSVLHDALKVRIHVFNASKESDLEACKPLLESIKKTTIGALDLERIIEAKRTELKAAAIK